MPHLTTRMENTCQDQHTQMDDQRITCGISQWFEKRNKKKERKRKLLVGRGWLRDNKRGEGEEEGWDEC